jgi:hypothetical protein
MLFCKPEVRGAIVANLAGHLEPGGLLIAGFGLDAQPGAITLAEYDHAASEAGLELVDRFATWEGAPYDDGRYAVSIHRHVRPR